MEDVVMLLFYLPIILFEVMLDSQTQQAPSDS